jgi:hypothetical protein
VLVGLEVVKNLRVAAKAGDDLISTPISGPMPVSTLSPNAGVPIVLVTSTWIGIQLGAGLR